MTDKEKAIRWFENIANKCDKLTSGNVAHLRAQIKGMAIRSAEYLTKHSQEPASEDLEQAAEKYCSDNSPFGATCRACFRDGAQWQKEQMMRYAVPSDYHKKYINDKGDYFPFVTYADMDDLKRVVEDLKLKGGDKVKVIIIKD